MVPYDQMLIHKEPNIRIGLGDEFPDVDLYEIRHKTKTWANTVNLRFIIGRRETFKQGLNSQ